METALEIQKLAMILFTVVMSIAAISYAVYMITALITKRRVRTPDERTFRLAFFVIIMVVIAFLGLGLGGEIEANLLAILGTIAGYVLGGITPSRQTSDWLRRRIETCRKLVQMENSGRAFFTASTR